MSFNEAYRLLNLGKKIKLPTWSGYWVLEEGTIMMHLKDGSVMDMFDSDNKPYTLSNIASNEWMEATKANTPILGGNILLTFEEMCEYLTALDKKYCMRRASWPKHVYICDDGDYIMIHDDEFDTDKPTPYLVSAYELEATDWEFYESEEE